MCFMMMTVFKTGRETIVKNKFTDKGIIFAD